MRDLLLRFSDDTGAATAVEYGLIAALIALATIGAFTFAGASINNQFMHLGNVIGAGSS